MKKQESFICHAAERLDTFLSSCLDKSRSQVAQLVKKECVFVDGKIVSRGGVKIKENQKVKVLFPDAQINPPLDIEFDVEILYEDDVVLVINKPSGLTVHPAPSVKEATLVDWLKHKGVRLSTLSGEERHGIVHRLDKGTSGVMIVAKTDEAHEFLSLQLQDKSMGRYYLAVVNPPLKDDLIHIERPIGRSTHNRLKMACLDDGKYAKTAFKVLLFSNDEKNQLLACKLSTGRTHQIRVHLESINRHIIGDHLYANNPKADNSERILLHAYMLYFTHPMTKEKLSFVAPLDEKMIEYLDKKFDMEQINEVTNPSYIVHGFATNN